MDKTFWSRLFDLVDKVQAQQQELYQLRAKERTLRAANIQLTAELESLKKGGEQ